MLKSIAIVTIIVQQLAAVETAYEEHFDYRVADRGDIPAALAGAWAAPETEGAPYVLMQPSDGKPVYLRFVESGAVPGYAPMRTNGWNAIELLVEDPDAMAENLAGSPFELIGPPKDLWAAPDAPRAMQVLGPGNEVVYLTRNGDFTTDLPVDRVFIMVLGGPSMGDLQRFYTDRLGAPAGESTPFEISVISNALDLPPETRYPLAIAVVSPDYLIELDEYPEATVPRPVPEGGLPPGIAMTSFTTDSLAQFDLTWRAEPRAIDVPPYDGRRTAVTVGPAGEWIEIIETPAD